MAAPLLRRKSVLAAKVEAGVGTAESLSASEAAFNVFDASIEPMIDYVAREGQGATLSPITGTRGPTGGRAKFSVELTGGASAPAWASTFLPACGLYLNSLTLTPESKPPEASGANTKTLTIALYIDGVKKAICGAMGNAVFRFTSGQRIMVDFDFTGKWIAPSNVAVLAPTFPTAAPLRFVSSAVLVGSFSPKIESMEIDLGNTVVLREDSGDATGYHSAVITGRAAKGRMNPELTLTGNHSSSVWDVYADWIARTQRQLSLESGTTGNKVAFTCPKMEITNVTPGERNGLAIEDIEFQLNRSADAGEDEISIVMS